MKNEVPTVAKPDQSIKFSEPSPEYAAQAQAVQKYNETVLNLGHQIKSLKTQTSWKGLASLEKQLAIANSTLDLARKNLEQMPGRPMRSTKFIALQAIYALQQMTDIDADLAKFNESFKYYGFRSSSIEDLAEIDAHRDFAECVLANLKSFRLRSIYEALKNVASWKRERAINDLDERNVLPTKAMIKITNLENLWSRYHDLGESWYYMNEIFNGTANVDEFIFDDIDLGAIFTKPEESEKF